VLQAQRFSCARVESRCAMLRFKTCAAVSAGGVRGLVSAASTEVLFSKVTDGKQRSKRSKKKKTLSVQPGRQKERVGKATTHARLTYAHPPSLPPSVTLHTFSTRDTSARASCSV
jgi:hypothetical protein